MTDKGELIADLETSNKTYTRFKTKTMSEILPDAENVLSGWGTKNFYFYEIVNRGGWTIVNKKDTIFKYIFWERLDSLPIPESCFHFVWCQIA